MIIRSMIFNLFQLEYTPRKAHQEGIIPDIIIRKVYGNPEVSFDTPYEKGSVESERIVQSDAILSPFNVNNAEKLDGIHN